MVVEINPDAWTIAKELDEERAAGMSRGFAIIILAREFQLLIESDLSMAFRFSSRTTLLLLTR